jgi:hypothetical protein
LAEAFSLTKPGRWTSLVFIVDEEVFGGQAKL